MAITISTQLLDASVLSILSRGDTYGYILTQQVKDILDISESTLYPVLRRLQKDGSLQVYDQIYQGRNRRYYTISEFGRMQLEKYKKEWVQYRDGIDQLLIKGE